MSGIKQHVRRLNLDARIQLFDIDLRGLGGKVQHVAPMSSMVGGNTLIRVTETRDNDYASVTGALSERMDLSRPLIVRIVLRRRRDGISSLLRVMGSDENRDAIIRDDLPDAQARPIAGTEGQETFVSALGPDHIVVVLRAEGIDADTVKFYPAIGFTDDYPSFDPSATGYRDIVELDIFEEDESGALERLDDDCNVVDWGASSDLAVEELENNAVNTPIMWRGNKYVPVPMEVEGFELSGDSLPRPTMSMSNALGVATRLCRDYRDLEGAEVTRWVTYRRFLDDGGSPDPNSHLPLEIYSVDQKTNHRREVVEWELASALDQQGARLPARQVLRNACQLSYRVWDTNRQKFDYDTVTCPYAGGKYFNEKNEESFDPREDRCNHQLSGCLKRFGDPTGQTNPPIRFGGFPAVGRIKQ